MGIENNTREVFKKIEQESPDFSQERNALFSFFCQLLGVLVSDILFCNLLAHVPQGAHVVAVWLHRWPPQKLWFLISGCAARNIFALWPFRCFTIVDYVVIFV